MEAIFYILVPVYQAENFLRECIESVLKQTYRKYHIILVDDGSSDSSGYICDDYAKDNNQIHVIHQTNRGQLAARLNAVNKAKQLHMNCDNLGYLLFLDADDILAENTLELLVDFIQNYKTDCVVINWTRFDKYDDIKDSLLSKKGTPEYVTGKKNIYKRVLTDNSLNSMCRKVIRIENFSDKEYSNLYHLRNGEDLIQSLDIYKRIDSIILSNTYVYFYRQNLESVTHRRPNIENATDFTIRELVLTFLEESKAFSEKDYCEYFKYCRDFLLGEIFIFINADMPVRETCILIDQISSSEYFAKVTNGLSVFSCTSTAKTMIFKLLLNKITRNGCIMFLKMVSKMKQRGKRR